MITDNRFEDYIQLSALSSTNELEELHSDHEKQKNAERSTHSWVQKGHPLGRNASINWKLGALLLGDGHIQRTPNEGLTHTEGLKFFHEFTTLLMEKAEAGNESLGFLQEHASKVKEFSEKISEAEAYSKRIGEMAQQGKNATETDRSLLIDRYAEELLLAFQLKGEGWLPIGWTTRNGESHAMLACIDMKGKLTIVNTGGGAENHPAISVSSQDPLTGKLKEEMKVQEFITYEGISKSKLERSELFRFFLELQVRAYWDGLIDFSPKNIYGPLQNYLSVHEKRALSPFKYPKAYKKPQKAGTCAVKSISTTLYYMLTESLNNGGNGEEKGVHCYKKIKYLWQTQALVELGLQIGPTSTETQRHFLGDFVENICRSAEKLHRQGLLEERDLVELNCTVEEIQERVHSSQLIQDEHPTLIPVKPELTGVTGEDSLYPRENIRVSQGDSQFIKRDLLNTLPRDRSNKKNREEEALRTIYEGLPRIHEIASPIEKIQELLHLFNSIDSDLLENRSFTLTKQATLAHALLEVQASFISTLPIPVKGEPSVWSQMPPPQAVEAMESVCQLMDLLNTLQTLYRNRSVVVDPVTVTSGIISNLNLMSSEFNRFSKRDESWSAERLSSELTKYREEKTKDSHPPDFIVMNYALLAISDQLARTLPEAKLEGFEINYHDLFFMMKSPHFILKNPRLQNTLGRVAKYFNPNFSLEALTLKEKIGVIKEKCNTLFAYKEISMMHSDGGFLSGSLTLENTNIRFYTTARYYLQFLQEIRNDPAKLSRFYSTATPSSFPVTPKSSELEHLAYLITTTTKEESLIPKSVKLLQCAALICLELQSPRKLFREDIAITRLTQNVDGSTYLAINRINSPFRFYAIQDEYLERAFYSDPETYSAVDWQRELTRENEIILSQERRYGQTLDISREIELVAVDPYDEVARALSFIKNHPHLIKIREIQHLIEAAFFKFGRLNSQLCDDPQMANEILTTIQEALSHYQKLEDLNTCLYLVKLGQEIFTYAKGVEVLVHDRNYRSVIYDEILPLFRENPSAKTRCLETLINFYRMTTPEDLNTPQSKEELLYDLATLWTIKGNNQDVKECRNLRIIELKLTPLIKESLLDFDFRKRNLNRLVKQFYPDAVESDWEGTFPFFENESYSYNLVEGILFDKQYGRFTFLPKEIYRDEQFKKVFSGEVKTCEKIQNGTLTSYRINAGLEDNLVIVQESSKLKFQRMIGGFEYHLIETPATLKNGLPGFVDDSSHCWVHGSSNPHMIVFGKSGRPLLHVELQQNQAQGHKISKVYRYHEEGGVDGSLIWTPFEKAPRSMQFLSQLETDCGYIECWSDHPTNTGIPVIQKAVLPRLNLSFQVKSYEGERLLFCQEHPGYYLVENPEIPSLPKIECFLILQNRAGKRKLLLPRVQLTVAFNHSPFDRTVKQKVYPPYSLLEYTLEDSGLKSNTMEGKLYTLYHTLAVGDFNKALKEVQTLTPLNRFRDESESDVKERKTLRWIFDFLAQDGHPSAKAIYLKLAVKVIHNELKYPRAINSAPDEGIFEAAELLKQLMCYTMNSSNVTTSKLGEKEEKLLIDFIQKSEDKETKSDLDSFYKSNRSEYHNYLKTGSAKIGTRTINPIQPKKGIELIENLLKRYFEDFSTSTPPPELHHLIQKKDFFRKYFFHLYQIAQDGSENDKKRIRSILEFNSRLDEDYHRILQNVLKTPSSYPSIKELTEALKEKKDPPSRGLYSESRFDRLIGKIAPGFLSRLWETIEKTSQMVLDLLFGKFSLLTILYENLSSVFRPTYRKDTPKKASESPPMKYDGATLRQTDQAFDHYFQELLTKYFTVEEVTLEVDSSLLPEEHPNIHVAKKLKAENEDLAYHRARMGTTKKVYSQKIGMDLEELIKELDQTAANLNVCLKTQKSALLWFLNEIPEQVQNRSLKQLHKTGLHHKIHWEDLQKITLKGDLETFLARTHLSEEEAKKVMYSISDYLIKASRLDQMKGVMAAAGQLQTIHETEKRRTYLQHVPKALELVRAYQPDSSNLEKQWFEAANHYLIRHEQLEKMREFINPAYRHIQAEAPTGFGKTETITPNLDYLRVAEGKLVFNTWPASLEIQNAANNNRQMDLSFGRKVDRFHFDRATTLSKDSLRHIYEEMLLDQREGRPINLRSESLRSLELHLLILLKEASEVKANHRELKGQIDSLLKILHLVRTEGWVTIDEEHVNLDPMDKLIYTVGDSLTLPKKEIDIFEALFEFLTAEESGRKLLEDNRQYLLPEDAFKNAIAPTLAEAFRIRLKVSEEHREGYEAFVLGASEEIPNWLKNHPQKGSIALVKGLLTQVLRNSFSGAVDEAFGLSRLHLNKKEFAIPYAFANTPKETKENPSQFKNPHETATKTYLTYLHKGLARDQFNKLIDFLQVQAKKELDNGSLLERTEAHEFFCKIAPNSRKSLIKLSDRDIEALYSELYRHRDVIFYYIRNIVLPELKIYPEFLVSTVHDFRNQFSSSLSLSATPQEREAHGLDTHFIPMRGTSGQVTHLLLTKCKDPATLHPMRGVKPKELLAEAFDIMERNPKIHAPIDIEANFKGLTNREVANEMCKRARNRNDIGAILFFDESQGLFKMMDVATGHIHDAIDSDIPPEETQTYYDQSRCFGSDIKQAIDAVGLLMTGKNTSKAKAGQGGGRMRLWHHGQSVNVSYPEHLSKDIFNDQQPGIEKLITYWLVNQVKSVESKNNQSQIGLMDSEIRRALMDRIEGVSISENHEPVPGGPTVEQAISCFNQWKNQFSKKESYDPWEMYAAIPKEEETIAVLKQYQEECLKKVEELPGLSRKEKAHITSRLNQYLHHWPEMVLPEKVFPRTCDLGMECEVLQEVEVETQVEIQAQVHEELQKRTPLTWPEALNLFSAGWDEPKKIHGIVKRIFDAAVRFAPPHEGVSLFKVNDLIGFRIPSFEKIASEIFAQNLLVSNNFYKEEPNHWTERAQTPMTIEQKPLVSLVVIMDEKSDNKKDVKAVIIDQNDSIYFRRKLQEDHLTTDEATAGGRKRQIGLYDISNQRFTVQGKNRFSESDLTNPELTKLVAQAKFLNGEVKYSREEMDDLAPRLERTAKKVGYGLLQKMFERIVQFHPTNRQMLFKERNPLPIAKALGYF